MRLSAAAIVVVSAALLIAGCGGGSGGTGSSTAPGSGAANGGEAAGGGAAKKATAPNAPAGSKVVSCGTSGAGTAQLRAAAVDCGTAQRTMRRWGQAQGCALAKDASRASCSLAGFRCQAVRTGRGVAVSCARPGGDIAFVAKGR